MPLDFTSLRVNERYRRLLNASGGGDANTTLLASFDGADAATTYEEESTNARSATFVGQAQLDTTEKVFGTASLLLDGADDWLTFPSADYGVQGSGDFTIEFRVHWNTDPATGTFPLITRFENAAGEQGWALYFINNELQFNWSDEGTLNTWLLSSTGAAFNPVVDTNYAIAVVREGGTLSIYVDGTRIVTGDIPTIAAAGSSPNTIFAGTTQVLRVGSSAHSGVLGEINGFFDELRISSVARYSGASYTLATLPFES